MGDVSRAGTEISSADKPLREYRDELGEGSAALKSLFTELHRLVEVSETNEGRRSTQDSQLAREHLCHLLQSALKLNFHFSVLEACALGRDGDIAKSGVKRQRTIRRLIGYDVHCRQNAAVEAFQKANDDFWSRVTGEYQSLCPECGGKLEDALPAPSSKHRKAGFLHTCPHCDKGFSEAKDGIREVQEWWAVSDWLEVAPLSRRPNGGVILRGEPARWQRERDTPRSSGVKLFA